MMMVMMMRIMVEYKKMEVGSEVVIVYMYIYLVRTVERKKEA